MSENNRLELAPLSNGKFTFTHTGLVIDESTTYEEWEGVGQTLQHLDGALQWGIGDWINFGECKYGEKYTQAIEETGLAYDTLVKRAWLSRKFEILRRRSNLGIAHHEIVASLEEEDQDFWLNKAETSGWSKARLSKEVREAKKRRPLPDPAIEIPANEIHEGDVTVLDDIIEDDFVDMFFTDPPYHEEHTDTYYKLGELAAKKLRPGGLCLAYSGQMHLPLAMDGLAQSLVYWWTFALRHTGGHLTIWNRYLWNDWKPILVFAKPYDDGTLPLASEWVQDFVDGGGRDKAFHDWGQAVSEATYWIEKLTAPDALICDPFVGGGTIPVACKLTGRRWIGSDSDASAVLTARQRLDEIK